MSAATAARPDSRGPALQRPGVRRAIVGGIVLIVLVAMALSTTYVPKGQPLPGQKAAFSASAYGQKQFPVQQAYVVKNAVPATTLAAAIQADQNAAIAKYGVTSQGGVGAEIPVSFTGKVGEVPAAGYTPVTVSGLPSDVKIAVQLGPAVTGTDLRDATGKIQLGDFENQIQYQNAGTAINQQMKAKVLQPAGAPDLTGKTITVQGVFSLINPKAWNVTPATLKVGQ